MRERAVAALIARGLTSQLVIAQSTSWSSHGPHLICTSSIS
jgi:hypothetical protein